MYLQYVQNLGIILRVKCDSLHCSITGSGQLDWSLPSTAQRPPDYGSTTNKAQVNVSIIQTPLIAITLLFHSDFFLTRVFLVLLHSLLFNTSCLIIPLLPQPPLFFLPSFICEHPVFCLWKWTAQSRCSPASTPPIFRLLLATTKYLRMRRVRTRVPLHRSYQNIPQCLWLCATVQRTRTI